MVTFNDVSVSENVAGGNATLTVILDRNCCLGDPVSFSVLGRRRHGDLRRNRFRAASTPITIRAGSKSSTVTVPITNDAIIEHSETFDVSITGTSGNVLVSGATTPDNTATVTINDDNKYSVSHQLTPLVLGGRYPR